MQEEKSKKKVNYQILMEMLDEAYKALKNNEGGMVEKYITVLARFPEYSTRNVLLTAIQFPKAEALHTKEDWKKTGSRLIGKPEPVYLLFPNYNADNDYLLRMEKMYDVSQTDKGFLSSAYTKAQLVQLQAGLFNICPVEIVKDVEIERPAVYAPDNLRVYVRLKKEDPVDWCFEHTVYAAMEAIYDNEFRTVDASVRRWLAEMTGRILLKHYNLKIYEKKQPVLPKNVKKWPEDRYRVMLEVLRGTFYKSYLAFEESRKAYGTETGQGPEESE